MIGEKLRSLRHHYNLTQEMLARKLNITKSTISMYENNTRTPTLYLLKEMADFFNVPIDVFLSDEFYPRYNPYNQISKSQKDMTLNELLLHNGYLSPGEKLSNKEINNIVKLIINNKDLIRNQK